MNSVVVEKNIPQWHIHTLKTSTHSLNFGSYTWDAVVTSLVARIRKKKSWRNEYIQIYFCTIDPYGGTPGDNGNLYLSMRLMNTRSSTDFADTVRTQSTHNTLWIYVTPCRSPTSHIPHTQNSLLQTETVWFVRRLVLQKKCCTYAR